MAMTVWLIRHAKADQPHNLPESQWPLSAEGKAQARALANRLEDEGVAHLYSSPFVRARETLAPYAMRRDIEVRIEEDLRERRLAGDLIADFVPVLRRSFAEPETCLPGGESHAGCTRRIVSALRRITARHDGETVGICSHGVAITSLIGSLDPSVGFDFWQRLKNPHLIRLDVAGDEISWRDTTGVLS